MYGTAELLVVWVSRRSGYALCSTIYAIQTKLKKKTVNEQPVLLQLLLRFVQTINFMTEDLGPTSRFRVVPTYSFAVHGFLLFYSKKLLWLGKVVLSYWPSQPIFLLGRLKLHLLSMEPLYCQMRIICEYSNFSPLGCRKQPLTWVSQLMSSVKTPCWRLLNVLKQKTNANIGIGADITSKAIY